MRVLSQLGIAFAASILLSGTASAGGSVCKRSDEGGLLYRVSIEVHDGSLLGSPVVLQSNPLDLDTAILKLKTPIEKDFGLIERGRLSVSALEAAGNLIVTRTSKWSHDGIHMTVALAETDVEPSPFDLGPLHIRELLDVRGDAEVRGHIRVKDPSGKFARKQHGTEIMVNLFVTYLNESKIERTSWIYVRGSLAATADPAAAPARCAKPAAVRDSVSAPLFQAPAVPDSAPAPLPFPVDSTLGRQ